MRFVVRACLVAVLATGCATLPSASEPCAGVTSYKDDFGKSTRGLLVYFDNGFRASGLLTEQGRMILRALFAINGVTDVTIPAGTPAQIALADGTVLDLVTAKASTAVAGANSMAVFTQWAVDFAVTKDQAARLSSSPLKAIKLQLGSDELLVRLSEDKGGAMQYLAQCLAPDIREQTPAAVSAPASAPASEPASAPAAAPASEPASSDASAQ
jgi:hypothetical protein